MELVIAVDKNWEDLRQILESQIEIIKYLLQFKCLLYICENIQILSTRVLIDSSPFQQIFTEHYGQGTEDSAEARESSSLIR